MKTILIVDDMQIEHINAKFVIEDFDPAIQVYSAYDGEEALEILEKLDSQNEAPDVIFLDINMPRMNGHEFLKAYSQSQNSSAVIVMLTSSYQEEDRRRCQIFDFVKDYITKPLDEEYLRILSSRL